MEIFVSAFFQDGYGVSCAYARVPNQAYSMDGWVFGLTGCQLVPQTTS